jgi:hypothetical protein
MLSDFVRISPPGSPEGLKAPLWDLSQYAPSGNGVQLGMLVMPYGAAPTRSPGYALYEHVWHPLLGAPPSEATGGVIYFGRHTQRADFEGMLRCLDVRSLDTHYLAYSEEASDVGRQAFVTQLRLISGFAMKFMFGLSDVAAQPSSIGEALWRFVELDHVADVDGALGGDGDWAYEKIAFGLMVENAYHGIYRIWSRPYLVSK